MTVAKTTSDIRVTVGADPEYFVLDKEKNEIVPACGLFGGGKGAPLFLTPDGGFLEDGVAIELNVAPQPTLAEVKAKILGLKLVWENQFPKYRLIAKPSHIFKNSELKNVPQANAIGCSADYWAYGIRELPQIDQFRGRRFAGGHIHLGLDPWPEELTKQDAVVWLDMHVLFPFAGRGMVDGYRWQFYGHQGLYRTTNYGVEYRSPDNSWASDDTGATFLATTAYFDTAIASLLKYHKLSKSREGFKYFTDVSREWLEGNGFLQQLQATKSTKMSAWAKGYNDITHHISSRLKAYYGS